MEQSGGLAPGVLASLSLQARDSLSMFPGRLGAFAEVEWGNWCQISLILSRGLCFVLWDEDR